jgi:hypothetical protein
VDVDLKKYDSITNAETGVDLILEPGAGITLYGADSLIHKEKAAEIQRKNRERRSALEAKEIEAQSLELIVACTKGWYGLEENGKPLEFSKEAATKLYKRYPEIADRVTSFIFTRANFFTTASAS